jgi:hypothetical protein
VAKKLASKMRRLKHGGVSGAKGFNRKEWRTMSGSTATQSAEGKLTGLARLR